MAARTVLLSGAAPVRGHDDRYDDRRELLRPSDIEVIYGIPMSTQAKGRMTGETYPYVKRGRSVYAFRGDVEDWLRGLRRRSTSEPGPQDAALGDDPQRRGRTPTVHPTK